MSQQEFYEKTNGALNPDRPQQLPAQQQHQQALIHDIYEKRTGSWQYIVADAATLRAAIIDPVLDYEAATTTISTENADYLLAQITQKGYTVDMILETHAHADHITAASYLQSRLAEKLGVRPKIGIGRRIAQVQATFGYRYNLDRQHFEDVFDKLFEDDEVFQIGLLSAMAVHIPGHTPDHMAYRVGDNDIFTGDCIFHADLGTARADFPGGSAEALFASGRKVLSLPDDVTVWSGHDYPPIGRDAPASRMTVAEHRERNKHLRDSVMERDFVELRKQRDATLAEPRLIHPSLQMNLRAGKLPQPNAFGHRILSLPLKVGGLEW